MIKKIKLSESELLSLINKIIFESNADVIRNYSINKLKWGEKKQELSSGGDITLNIANVMNHFTYEIVKYNPKCIGRFTSGNDLYHQKITRYVSQHKLGNAVDFTLPNFCHSKAESILKRYSSILPGFKYINEYKNPSNAATGGHFHVELRNK